MKNLIIRTLTGLAVVGVVLGSILYNEYTFAFLFALILILGLHEFYQLFKNSLVTPHRLAGYVLGLAVFWVLLAIAASILEPVWLLAVPVLLLVVFGAELSRAKEYPAGNIAITVFGALYLALPLGLAGFLVFPEEIGITEYTPHILVALLSFIWIYDSGAYLFGVSFGRHRLFERISPKKSWEGALGGAVFTMAASRSAWYFIPEIAWRHWLAISILVVISATFGDLSESMLKRASGVKDSGNILPGHGGILDRFDSLLFVVPVVVFYLKIVLS